MIVQPSGHTSLLRARRLTIHGNSAMESLFQLRNVRTSRISVLAAIRLGTEVAVARCAMKRTVLISIALLVLTALCASPAAAESMHLRALRVARMQYPGRSGGRRITVAEVPAAASGKVAFRVIAEGIPPETYVVFERDGAGWKSLRVTNSPDGRTVDARPHRRGRK